jgi:hypothetical protein|tara:strand:+ start:131 stop:298 length:168 start_codon:yes stop_codon:yes gene_type:complete
MSQHNKSPVTAHAGESPFSFKKKFLNHSAAKQHIKKLKREELKQEPVLIAHSLLY